MNSRFQNGMFSNTLALRYQPVTNKCTLKVQWLPFLWVLILNTRTHNVFFSCQFVLRNYISCKTITSENGYNLLVFIFFNNMYNIYFKVLTYLSFRILLLFKYPMFSPISLETSNLVASISDLIIFQKHFLLYWPYHTKYCQELVGIKILCNVLKSTNATCVIWA